MSQLTKEEYERQQAECDGLCVVEPESHKAYDPGRPDRMPCVTCPFCKKVVDAILTPATISCPACLVTVQR